MLSTIVLLVVSIAIVVLLTPVVREPFVSQIESPPCGIMLGGQGEEAEAHATDIHSRISRVRLTDPTSRWSQSY
jgi:hypothetical protein